MNSTNRLLTLLFLILAPLSARADATLDELLDRWAEAVGGREVLAKPVVLEQYAVGKAFGLPATIRSRSTLDGRIRMDIDLGGGLYTFLQVFDGEKGWQVDQNGKLSPLEGADLRGVRTTAHTDRNRHLFDDSSSTVELLEPHADGPRILCTPEGADPITYVLDADTGLPLRMEMPQQERVLTVTIHDWFEQDGHRIPGNFDQSTGDPQYDAHFEIQEVVFHDAVDPAWFQPPSAEGDDVVWDGAHSIRDIPIELNTVHIYMQCSVNGSEPLWFILDTGASITVMNKRTAQELGLKLEGSIEGRGAREGTSEVQLAGGVSYGVPGVTLKDQTVATIDLDRIEGLTGRRLDGILGFDFISRFVVEIDYAGRSIHLHDRKDWAYAGKGSVCQLSFESSLPHTDGELHLPGREPIVGKFMIDTGANSSVAVARPFHEAHGLIESLETSVEFGGGFGVGGRSKSIVGRVPEFRIGGLSFPQLPVGFSADERGAHADPNVAGLIGGHILERCRVFFDYERARMILEPHDGMNQPFKVDSLGLIATSGGRGKWNQFIVLDVLPGMAAEAAGLQKDDEILAFDGTPMSEMNYQDMWLRTQSSTDRVVLRIRRGGSESDVEVQLKPMI
jgi:hypothetical protein